MDLSGRYDAEELVDELDGQFIRPNPDRWHGSAISTRFVSHPTLHRRLGRLTLRAPRREHTREALRTQRPRVSYPVAQVPAAAGPSVGGPHPGRPKPEPGTDEWEALRACFEQHRDRYSESSWGHLAFEVGDVAAAIRANPLIPVE